MENDTVEITIKNKAKIYYQANKEKIQKRSHQYYSNFSEDEEVKKRSYAYSVRFG